MLILSVCIMFIQLVENIYLQKTNLDDKIYETHAYIEFYLLLLKQKKYWDIRIDE